MMNAVYHSLRQMIVPGNRLIFWLIDVRISHSMALYRIVRWLQHNHMSSGKNFLMKKQQPDSRIGIR